MSTPIPFQHAVANPDTRRDIALAVASGIAPEQLAAEFNISVSTVRAYAKEFEGTKRRAAALTDWERDAIRAGCRRGVRARYEREYTAAVVRQVMGE
ncbi:Uncharacterised protein [Mycobacteroides abscessus subsp. abscessus]|uniref:helix-turn-helix domain-containing protein n=1 Tax=Mycobacteroides abscessus TaxID=36809 RepID=UPI000928677C|nr:helix-turn-helix domain-containing protein [Mycobacteroides abscessus]MBE5513728.1 hypothetical protein [Mycobacteroides abscessus]MBN7327725.1 helix-turn-helix domain-containing protein [Mycobacteroides abscessus subsp. abscessus]SID62854.1 Uncharacterised protein [Mycobacteroides abscessus subsp. abscessus]SIE82658.1 Uncharacterised protein [Mycobacteroides abscessus subsp. abscessus]SIF73041.1 Uncharacterised protein [Mycobacteroides abscessus subsp. abscessus]